MLRSFALALLLAGLLYWVVVKPVANAGRAVGYSPASLTTLPGGR